MRRPSGTDTGTGTGAGKSHLLIALGTEAAVAGYRVKYVLATKLVNARGKRHPVAVFTTARSAGRCHDADGAAALHYTRRPTPCAADAPEQAAHGPAPGEPVAAERGHQLPRRGSCSPDERGELRERGGGETGAPGSCGRQKNPERHRYSCASTTIGGRVEAQRLVSPDRCIGGSARSGLWSRAGEAFMLAPLRARPAHGRHVLGLIPALCALWRPVVEDA